MADTTPSTVTADPSRFSIRLPRPLWIGLAAVVLVVAAVGLQIVGRIYRQRSTITEIRRIHGRIEFRHRGPEWLRSLVGKERLELVDEIEGIRFLPELSNYVRRSEPSEGSVPLIWATRGPRVDDTTLACIDDAPNLKRLDLSWAKIGDAGLTHLGRTIELEELSLKGTFATDASIEVIGRLTRLKRLAVGRTDMTDREVSKLERVSPGLVIER